MVSTYNRRFLLISSLNEKLEVTHVSITDGYGYFWQCESTETDLYRTLCILPGVFTRYFTVKDNELDYSGYDAQQLKPD